MSYRLWVSADGTVLFRLWETGKAEVATRGETWESWGPPRAMVEEVTAAPAEPDPDARYDWDRDTLALDEAEG